MGMLRTLIDRHQAKKQQRANRAQFVEALRDAARDGTLTPEEMAELDRQREALGLGEEDIRPVRVEVFRLAYQAAAADGVISPAEEQELRRIQTYLEIPDAEIASTALDLSKLRLIYEIQQGNLPEMAARPGLVLHKGERCHWIEPASLLEERVVARRYEGGSHGVSLRIAKGLSYRVGAHRGQLLTDTAILPVSTGELVVTSQRLVFQGDRKSFTVKLDKLLNLQVYSDGLSVTPESGKPKLVKVPRQVGLEIAAAILAKVMGEQVAS